MKKISTIRTAQAAGRRRTGALVASLARDFRSPGAENLRASAGGRGSSSRNRAKMPLYIHITVRARGRASC